MRTMYSMLYIHLAFLLIFLIVQPQAAFAEKMCSYSSYKWNSPLKKAVEYHKVKRPYADLTKIEVHEATGCTVCIEDQVEINLPNVPAFKVCQHLAHGIKQTLIQAIERGELIEKVVGYRVGMTKGKLDKDGNRTQYSNHSFGIAIDINDHKNGLYDRCITFGPECRLIRGGPWSPKQRGSLTAESFIVRQMKLLGLQWGGEIKGRQKDFMHFSPSGY